MFVGTVMSMDSVLFKQFITVINGDFTSNTFEPAAWAHTTLFAIAMSLYAV
jgi:hypothetical protein